MAHYGPYGTFHKGMGSIFAEFLSSGYELFFFGGGEGGGAGYIKGISIL